MKGLDVMCQGSDLVGQLPPCTLRCRGGWLHNCCATPALEDGEGGDVSKYEVLRWMEKGREAV